MYQLPETDTQLVACGGSRTSRSYPGHLFLKHHLGRSIQLDSRHYVSFETLNGSRLECRSPSVWIHLPNDHCDLFEK